MTPDPLTCHLMTSTQGDTDPLSSDPSRPVIYSETGAVTELVSTLHIYTLTHSTSTHRCIPFLRTHTSPTPHPIHSPRRESGVESDMKGYTVCGLLADGTRSVFIAKDTHRKDHSTIWNSDLKSHLGVILTNGVFKDSLFFCYCCCCYCKCYLCMSLSAHLSCT